jgi:STE24 endopeptidase
LVPVFLLGIYIFLVFGFLSRRCERQADIFGCRAVSCQRRQCNGHDADTVLSPKGRGLCPTGILTFIEALEKVARLNGMSRDRPGWLQSWQHSTIACRVAFLQRLLEDPSLARRFQRRVTLVKWSLLLVVGAILALVIGSNWNSFQEPADLSAHPNRVHPDSPAT